MRKLCCLLLVLATSQLASAVAWGPRIGVTSDPDQFIGGVHFDAGKLTPEIRFQPNIQAGIGDDAFTFGGAGALHYLFNRVGGDWRPYAGGELGFIYINLDLPDYAPPGLDDTDTELGLSAAAGMERILDSGSLLQLELRIGFVDAQDLQFHVGWTFGGGGRSTSTTR